MLRKRPTWRSWRGASDGCESRIVPDKSRYRTSPVLELHMSGNSVNRELSTTTPSRGSLFAAFKIYFSQPNAGKLMIFRTICFLMLFVIVAAMKCPYALAQEKVISTTVCDVSK